MGMDYDFLDGFDGYTNISQVYDTVQIPGSGIVISSASARFPAPSPLTGQGALINGNSWARKNLPTASAFKAAGIAFKFNALPSVDAFIAFEDSTTTQVSLALRADGSLSFYRGAASTQIGAVTVPALITPGAWHYAEIVVTIDPTAGTVALYLDGNPTALINSTGLNTRSSANSSANQIRIGDLNNGSSLLLDDLYVLTGNTGSISAPLGDNRVFTKVPSGAGGLTAWTPNGAASNWQCVKDIPPDDDTTYVSDSNPGDRDSYAMQSAGITATPKLVVTRHRARKDDAGVRVMKPLVRSGGVVGLGSAITLPSTYQFFDQLFVNDPNTGSPWTGAAADATEVGQEMTS